MPAMIHVEPAGTIPVYVPIRCRRTLLVPELNDAVLHGRREELFLSATSPRVDGEGVHSGWAQVTDARGRGLLVVEELFARRFGEVPYGG